MINVFIGFDPDEAIAYSVLAYSIQARASQPVSTSTRSASASTQGNGSPSATRCCA
jgi:hypothetical protein